MPRVKTKEEDVISIINSLIGEGVSMTYQELMEAHRHDLGWAVRYMRDNEEVMSKHKEVIKRALVNSVLELHELGVNLRIEHVQKTHSGLEAAARRHLRNNDEKPSWQTVVEAAGLEYPAIYQKQWTLNDILGQASSIGQNPLDFRLQNVASGSDSAFFQAVATRFGYFGKVAMLCGVDYLEVSRIVKSRYSFTDEDFKFIMEDETISLNQKIRCMFNALSLQYYPFDDYQSQIRIGEDKNETFYNFIQSQSFFDGAINVDMFQHWHELKQFKVSISLDGSIENRFDEKEFHFSGHGAGKEATDFMNFYLTGSLVYSQLLAYRTDPSEIE